MNHALVSSLDHFKSIFLRNEEVSLASIGALMLLAILGMGAISLAVLNTKATKGYQLNSLETTRQELVTDLEISDTLILRAQSMNTIEDSTRHMVKASSEDVYYVVPTSAVALSGQ